MKKIDELRQQLDSVKTDVRSLLEQNKVEDAENKMVEVRNLEKQIKLQAELDEAEEREIETKIETRKEDVKVSKVNEYRALAKFLSKQELSTEERASINVTNGGALMPAGFVKEVEVLTEGYPALKKYTHVIPVTTNTGKMPISQGSTTKKLAKLAVDTALVQEMVTTVPVDYAVEDFGKIYPIENAVLSDAGVDLFNTVIAPDVAESATNSENAEIMAIVTANATIFAGTDYKAIAKCLNTKIKPSLKAKTVIVTNQTGYDYLDGLTDTTGRPMLADSLAVEGGKTFKGKEVIVLDDTALEPVTAGKVPFYVVNLAALVKFFDRKGYEVSVSTEALFTYNQTALKVVERFDVKKGDDRACFYVEVTA